MRVARTVKVKVEAGNDSAGDDDGEDDENNHGTSRSDAASVAARIYKKAHKMLKSKLYFESLFPVDAEKDTLPYSCWTSAISSMNEIGGDPAAARKMFYDFAYNDKVRVLILTIRSPPHGHAQHFAHIISPHLPPSSLINVSVQSGTLLSPRL